MWFENSSDEEDEQRTPGVMRGKITEKDQFDQQKKKCNCKKGCSKRSCACYKFGKGCNESCGCKTTCTNIFNHLDYFFGENHQCSASPCFANWITENIKILDDLQSIDREDFLRELMKAP